MLQESGPEKAILSRQLLASQNTEEDSETQHESAELLGVEATVTSDGAKRHHRCSPRDMALGRGIVVFTYFVAFIALVISSIQLHESGEEAHTLAW